MAKSPQLNLSLSLTFYSFQLSTVNCIFAEVLIKNTMFMKKELIEKAACCNILYNHRTVDRSAYGSELANFGKCNFIQGAEWMLQQFQWISVEDKLPPCSDDDLFLLGIDSRGGKDIPDIGYMHDSADHVPRKDLFISTELIEVTHWMKVRNLTKNE